MSVDLAGLALRLGEIFLYICLGVVCRKTGLLDDRGNKTLSRLLIYVGFPAILLNGVVSSDAMLSTGDVLYTVLVAFLWQGVCILLGLLAGRLLSRDPARRGMYAFALGFGNIGAFALPVLQPLFGARGMAMTSLMNVPFSMLAFTLGVRMVSGRPLTGREMLKGVVVPQLVVAVLMPTLLIIKPAYPALLRNAISGLGGVTVPLLMLSVGSSLAGGGLALWKRPRMYLAVAVKLLLIPLALAPLLASTIRDQTLQGTVTLLTGMPTAGIASAMCILYGNENEPEASSITVASTLLSLLTIPLLARLLL